MTYAAPRVLGRLPTDTETTAGGSAESGTYDQVAMKSFMLRLWRGPGFLALVVLVATPGNALLLTAHRPWLVPWAWGWLGLGLVMGLVELALGRGYGRRPWGDPRREREFLRSVGIILLLCTPSALLAFNGHEEISPRELLACNVTGMGLYLGVVSVAAHFRWLSRAQQTD